MSSECAQPDPVEEVESLQRIGWFRYYSSSDEWEWSDEVYSIHGMVPEGVRLSTETVLSFKHPDDRERIVALLDGVRLGRHSFSSRHRIVDARGVERAIVVVGDLLRDETGRVIGTQGFYIDGTSAERMRQQEITDKVAVISRSREIIDTAKGMLMAVYGLDQQTAFGLLKWRSQDTNVKLSVLAGRLVREFRELGASESLPARAEYDNVVMTAHRRV